jgi:gliding motility-associated-like protein
VHPKPTAAFVGSPTVTDILNSNIVFIDQSSLSTQWLYDFFDGTTSTDQNPVHTYTDTGTFNVQQTVTTEFGCADIAFSNVYITPVYNLYVPNAFTPNGNHHNEVFNAKGEGYDLGSYELKVFNRWGEEVFRTKSFDNGWDGTKNGADCEQGVYAYVLTVKSLQDYRQKTFFGKVTLLR